MTRKWLICRKTNKPTNQLFVTIVKLQSGWLECYGISSPIGYLMPNPVYIYIYIYINCKRIL